MMTPEIENLIVKYIDKSATADDVEMLSAWIKQPGHRREFKHYIKLHYTITYGILDPDAEEVIKELSAAVKKKKSIRSRLFAQSVFKYAAAAVLAGAVVTAYFFKDNLFDQAPVPKIVSTIDTGTDKATLTLDNGQEVFLHKGTSYQSKSASSNGEELLYKDSQKTSQEIIYNTLTIPRGGQFFIKLSDGTQVWLNSESKLIYPVNFKEGQIRKVELVYGEAYFSVSPSTAHQGAKFKVYHTQQEVQVLGTEFNIKAYKDESNIYTTLVEGRVAVLYLDKEQNLMPSEQANYNLSDDTFGVATVDVYNEISWKEGVFSFDEKSLKEIMKILSRWYDMEVEFQNKAAETEVFAGVLRKSQEINEILSNIKNFGIINDYEINNKKVILK